MIIVPIAVLFCTYEAIYLKLLLSYYHSKCQVYSMSSYFLDLGNLCTQLACVASFITSKLPCSRISETVCLVCLCLNENFRSAPKLNEAIVALYLFL